ncbi:MAG: ABC transporter ATP-binding protein [Acidimicrobiia bacterium]
MSEQPVLALRSTGLILGSRHVLAAVDWEVRPAERWVVLGPNGSGKTSLARLAAGYLHPSSGTVEILGHRSGKVDLRWLRSRIGFASGSLSSMLRPGVMVEDVVMSAKHAALETWWHDYDPADRARALNLLERMGCAHLVGRSIATASDGERQRVQLARTLMIEPDLIVLDEPSAGLDLGGREALLARLAELATEPKAPPTILVTHHVEEIPPGFTHALLLRDGRVLQAGPLNATVRSASLSSCFGVQVCVEQRRGRYVALPAQ